MFSWNSKLCKLISKFSCLSAILLLLALTITNIILLFTLHNLLSSPKSDILGAPLLYVHGARNLQLGMFLLTEIVLSPLYFLLARVIFQKVLERRKINIEKVKISDLLNYEFILFAFFLVRFIYYIFSKMSNELIFSPIKELFFFISMVATWFLILVLMIKFARVCLKMNRSRTNVYGSILNLSLVSISGMYFFLNYANVAPRIGFSIFLVFSGIFLIAVLGGDISFGQKIIFDRLRGIFLIPLTSFFFFSKPLVTLNLHPFESHGYANAQLFLNGALPWKDFSLEHGLWEDLGRNIIASLTTGNSDLQQAFGISSIVRPLEFAILGVCLFLVSKNYWFPCLALGGSYFISIVTNYNALYLTRIIPLIVLTVLLKELYRKRSKSQMILLGVVSGLQVFISPDWFYLIPIVFFSALWVILRGDERLNVSFSKILVYIGCLLASVFVPLVLMDLVIDFVQHFLSSSGYLFAWGGTYQLGNAFFADLILILIPISLFMSSSYLFNRPSTEIVSRISQFIWLAPLFFTLLAYFVKFMIWPDVHLVQPTSVLMLGFLFLTADYISRKNDSLRKSSSIFCVAFIICLVCGLATTSHYQEASQPSAGTLTYNAVTKKYMDRVYQVNETFAKYLPKGRNSKILDFGNEPVTWFNILGYSTSGGVSKVLNLYSSKSQLDAIKNMNQYPPDAVIWGGEFGYWEWPFNGNWMKHYHISSWILNNYVPMARDGNYVLMLPKLGEIPNLSASNQIKSVQCNWFNGASRFTLTQSLRSSVQKIPLSRFTTPINSEPISLRNRIDSKVLIIATNKATNLSLVDSQGNNGQINFVTTGNYVRDVIWLDQCPGYHFDGSQVRWIVTGLLPGVIAKVLN